MTVKEMAVQGHCSVWTLHHYDAIGLLKPTAVTEVGYRLYDEEALERLQLILLYRELGFSLEKIRELLEAPDEERNRILEEQSALLKAKAEQLQNRVHLAKGIQLMGVKYMEFKNWDPKKIDEYQAQYKAKPAQKVKEAGAKVMDFFTELGGLKELPPESEAVQAWVKSLQEFFTANFYDCTLPVLQGLGELYAGGGSMTENIDAAGGKGTGEFAKKAIDIYCAAHSCE